MVALHQHLLHLVHLIFEVGDALFELESFFRLRLLCYVIFYHLDTLGVVQGIFHLRFVVD